MYKITTLLDNAKELNLLKSDRELAKKLGLTSVHQFRTKGVVPSDDTAKKLADLTGIKYELVLASCHGATAKKNNDKPAIEAWRNIFKLTKASTLLVLAFVFVLSPTPSVAALSNITLECNIYYATFSNIANSVLVLLKLRPKHKEYFIIA